MMFIDIIGKSKIGPTARPFYITRSSMLNSDILYAASSGQMTGHVTFPSECQRKDETHLCFLELNYPIIS